MFGGPGAWLHTYVGGITNALGRIGFKHAMFAPPTQLIRQAFDEPSDLAVQSQGAALTTSAGRKSEAATQLTPGDHVKIEMDLLHNTIIFINM